MIAVTLLTLAAVDPGVRCSIAGWSNDPDPAGLRVHAGPSLASPEIGRLPPAVEGDVVHDDHYAPEFDITDVRNGWVRIAHAVDAENPGKERRVFGGTGWIHGSRVTFTIQSDNGRSRPDIHAPAIVSGGDWLGDAGGATQPLLGCSGGWARLRYRFPAEVAVKHGPRSGEAWFGGVCANQHTTCDSLGEKDSAPGR